MPVSQFLEDESLSEFGTPGRNWEGGVREVEERAGRKS